MKIQADLCWLADQLERLDGNLLLDSCVWHMAEADFVCTTDACPSGLGIWLPNLAEGFHTSLPLPSRDIFWVELAAASHGIIMGIERGAHKILVCSDSSNVCDLFLSHSPSAKVTNLFQAVITKIVNHRVDVRIAHIPGKKNVLADALSRGMLSVVKEHLPSAAVAPFIPFIDLPDGGFPSSHGRHVIPLPKRPAPSHRGSRC